jgi:Flp pilus assembly protein TadG
VKLRKQQQDRGAAAVEFALVAMILITILFGIVEFSRLWLVQSSLSAAARDGAREMAIQNDTGEAVAVMNARLVPLASAGTLSVSASPATGACDAGLVATATASINTTTMTGLFDPMLGGSITLTGRAEMRCNG